MHVEAAVDGLAENPALPAGLVWRLIPYRRGRRRVAARADLTGEMIDAIIGSGDHWLVHALALSPHLPEPVQLRLAASPDGAVRCALAGRSASPDVLAVLVDDRDRRVREAVAENSHCPANLRARLARDPDAGIRATLGRWWVGAPEAVRRVLLTDPVDTVREFACSTYFARRPHPVPPADLVPQLVDDPVTRAGAVRHAILTPELAERLAADAGYEVRAELARHPGLPAAVRDRLAEDRSATVRVAIFGRADTPEPTRRRIHDDVMSAEYDMLEAETEEAFADCFAPGELEDMHLAWVAADPLPHLGSPYVAFRASAGRSPGLPPEAVARLLADENNRVRLAAARTAPHLVDPATAERIDREFRPRRHTRWRPADVLPLPPEVLRRLATDPAARMRRLAPRDPGLPAELAERLAADESAAVRGAVAQHPNLPVPALAALLDDRDEGVVRRAAAAPRVPVAQMERIVAAAGLCTAGCRGGGTCSADTKASDTDSAGS
ncbi:hypothetical protein [Dactylosporangium sp. CA-139066]|uniref:hypothetical protein n=1 Tax=Dactylosporangium sp. CA-139066 TaxID=3239930 RepID=UPI003D8D3E77